MASKKSNKKPSKQQPQASSHEDRVFLLGSQLLSTLEKCRLPRNDENVKALGWFLVCVGESITKGCLVQARQIRAERNETQSMSKVSSIAVALCLMGDQIMDWSTGLFHQEKKENDTKGKDSAVSQSKKASRSYK